MQALGGSGREPDAPGSLPYGQVQLGEDLRASAGLNGASPSTSSLQVPDAFEGPDSGAASTRVHSHPGSITGLFDEPLLNSVAAQVTEDSFVSSSLAVSKALSSRSGSKPLAMSSSPLAGPSGYHPVRC